MNNPLVQPDPGLYIWTIVTFLVLLGLLAGCSSVNSRQVVDLGRFQRFYVERRLNENNHLDELIAAELRARGRVAGSEGTAEVVLSLTSPDGTAIWTGSALLAASPDGSGFDVCRTLRETGVTTPILMLTARDAVADRVEGLDAGADDYLVKPFAFDELLARLRAIARRGS
mgnify:CR=1 FL=1